MVSAWVLDNVPSGDWADQYYGYPYAFGNTFAPVVDCSVTRLRWRRVSTQINSTPDHLRLWDVATQEILAEVSPVPDDGAVGWQVGTIDTPPNVSAGQLLRASIDGALLWSMGYIAVASLYPPPPFPAGWCNPVGARATTNSPGYPDQLYDSQILPVDAELSGFLPTASWTLVDTTSYTDSLKWTVPADKYRLNVTTVVQWASAKVVQSEDTRRVVGAWWPFADGYKGQRLLIDAPKSELAQPNGRRMDGLLLDTGVGSAGTVEAYVLST